MQIRWGGRYSSLTNQGHRWFTGVLVHSSLMHIVSNTFMFLALTTYIEAKIGSLRIAGALSHLIMKSCQLVTCDCARYTCVAGPHDASARVCGRTHLRRRAQPVSDDGPRGRVQPRSGCLRSPAASGRRLPITASSPSAPPAASSACWASSSPTRCSTSPLSRTRSTGCSRSSSLRFSGSRPACRKVRRASAT